MCTFQPCRYRSPCTRPTPHSHFSTGLVMSAAVRQSALRLVLLASVEAERTRRADFLPAMGRRLSQAVMPFPRSALSPLTPPTAPARAADACVSARTGVGGWVVRVLGNRRPARVRKRRRMAGICRTAAFVCFAAATRRPVAAPRPASAGASTSTSSTVPLLPLPLPVRLPACLPVGVDVCLRTDVRLQTQACACACEYV